MLIFIFDVIIPSSSDGHHESSVVTKSFLVENPPSAIDDDDIYSFASYSPSDVTSSDAPDTLDDDIR